MLNNQRRQDGYAYHVDRLRALAYGVFRRVVRKRCQSYPAIQLAVAGKIGLEIGGPSRMFRKNGLIPIYDHCKRIDLCNFASQTIWSRPDDFRRMGCRFGTYYTAEASEMPFISDSRYDFILASHVLEHIANPLRALAEWTRVVRPGGLLLVIVPDKRTTFDRRRPYTSFEHVKADLMRDTPESDLSHMNEILTLHDFDRDKQAGSFEQLQIRCANNFALRAMHHHVFSREVLTSMLDYSGSELIHLSTELPYHIVAVAQKCVKGSDN